MPQIQPLSLKSPDALKLFCMGFLTLFLELALIRYLAGNIWNLGYFPNLVLISVFIGMGLGFMLHQYAKARLSTVLLQFSIIVLLALVAFVHVYHPSVPGFGGWGGDIGGDLYFTSTPEESAQQGYTPFVVCLTAIVAIFALLSQRTAKLFQRFSPLTAYTLDIAGSCFGIVCFMLVSWLQIPAWVWFGVFAVVLVAVMTGSWRWRWLPLVSGLPMVLLIHGQDEVLLGKEGYRGHLESLWSPYQRIQFVEQGLGIYANGVGHQRIAPAAQLSKRYYQTIHTERRRSGGEPYRNVLILGAGSGNDVAAALANGAVHVDAVEIDPAIAGIGKHHNPSRPYADERVNLVIDDGRAFMSRTQKRYDLIVFALTDSLVKVSSMSQLRLENYLFTVDSVRRAGELLAPGGDLIFYNFYRQPWLKQKIIEMVQQATGLSPKQMYTWYDFAVLRAHSDESPRLAGFTPTLDLPTDDWPFLYLVERGIPSVYQWAMLAMAAFVALLAGLLHYSTRRHEHYGRPGMLATKLAFVFMGMAFLLLETKSVIQFSLLFGTTWLNSSLVFLAVLLLVLAANWAATFIKRPSWMPIVYVALVTSCLATFVFPLSGLLSIESGVLRFVLASLMTFSPIFFANLIFSVTFRDQDVPEHLFGWNLIGATLGGVVEYTGMYFGYAFLSVLVAGAYTLVVLLLMRAQRKSATVSQGEPALAGGE